MIDVLFGEYLSRRIERWVKSGRRPEARPCADGMGYVLEHGPRVRLFWAVLAAVFGGFLGLGLWAQRTEAIASFWGGCGKHCSGTPPPWRPRRC